jgi:uncharacterized protein YggU (UPF0235/DUF167 family)
LSRAPGGRDAPAGPAAADVAGWWTALPDGRIRVRVSAVPGASRTGLADLRPDCLRIRLAAAPEKGKANDELLEWLAGQLGVRKSALELETGAIARKKTVLIPGGCREALEKLAKP